MPGFQGADGVLDSNGESTGAWPRCQPRAGMNGAVLATLYLNGFGLEPQAIQRIHCSLRVLCSHVVHKAIAQAVSCGRTRAHW